MSPGADRVLSLLRQDSRPRPGANSDEPPAPSIFPLRLLSRILPWAMLIVLVVGVGGGLRLAASLGQPFPGFALMWRTELNLFVVSSVTPPYWPGMEAGMRVNDRIHCLDGYSPRPTTASYGMESDGNQVDCQYGGKDYFEIFTQRYGSTSPQIDMLVQRQNEMIVVREVPVVLFNLEMLLETFLPSFLLGLGFLGLGAVVLRAGPARETNLVFALFTTLVAALAINQVYELVISPRLAGRAAITLLLIILWLPFVGAVLFHLLDLLTPSSPLARLNHLLRRPYYVLSALVAGVSAVVFAQSNHPLVNPVGVLYLAYIVSSLALTILWGLAGLAWTFWRAPSRRVRRQSGLVMLSLAVILLYMAPYSFYFLTEEPALNVIDQAPYLGLATVAILAYAILRYQVFASRARILTALLIAVVCILVANLIYLVVGQWTGVLPIMMATLLTGFVIEARQGPMSLFNRLLRREVLDFETVARFSEQVGQLQKVDALLAGIPQPLYDSLDIERIVVWLYDPAQPDQLQRFVNGAAISAQHAPEDLAMTLLAHAAPLRADQQQASILHTLAADYEPIAVWAPLVERGEVVGLMGLGPRWTGEVYGKQDLQLIGILARQMTLSILNTRQLEHLQAMTQLIAQAEENERRKIARELHDTILQFLLVLTYGLDDLKDRQTALTAEIERWQERISAEAGQLRSLLSYLRAPELLVQQGLVPSLQSWLEQVRQETTMTIAADLDPAVEPLLSTEAKVAIYRVCREAVHNAIKHSGGSRVMVKIWPAGEAVRFSVEDSGHGFDVTTILAGGEKGYSSLQDLRIYVESVSGKLYVRSEQSMGTFVSGWVPAFKQTRLFTATDE